MQLYNALISLTAKCRENQMEVLQLVARKAREAEQSFLDGREGDTDAAIEVLKGVASSAPGNILAAEAVASSLSEAMVNALVDRSMDQLQR